LTPDNKDSFTMQNVWSLQAESAERTDFLQLTLNKNEYASMRLPREGELRVLHRRTPN